jgi:hypothetical protein
VFIQNDFESVGYIWHSRIDHDTFATCFIGNNPAISSKHRGSEGGDKHGDFPSATPVYGACYAGNFAALMGTGYLLPSPSRLTNST